MVSRDLKPDDDALPDRDKPVHAPMGTTPPRLQGDEKNTRSGRSSPAPSVGMSLSVLLLIFASRGALLGMLERFELPVPTISLFTLSPAYMLLPLSVFVAMLVGEFVISSGSWLIRWRLLGAMLTLLVGLVFVLGAGLPWLAMMTQLAGG